MVETTVPNIKFVQLIVYQDNLVGLDDQGRAWRYMHPFRDPHIRDPKTGNVITFDACWVPYPTHGTLE